MYRILCHFSPVQGSGGWSKSRKVTEGHSRIGSFSSQLCWTTGTPHSPAPPSHSPPQISRPYQERLHLQLPCSPSTFGGGMSGLFQDGLIFLWPFPRSPHHSWSHLLAQHQGLQFLLLIQFPISTYCSLFLECSSCPFDPLPYPTGFSSKVPSSEEPPWTNQLSHQHPELPLHTNYPRVGRWLSTYLE